MKNALLVTLQIVELLGSGNQTLAALSKRFNLSPVRVKCAVESARVMGAHVVAVRGDGPWTYHLSNWSSCRGTVLRWIDLERSRSLV